MYYEEKVINGVLCFRTMPNTPFVEFSKERLTTKIAELEQKLKAAGSDSKFERTSQPTRGWATYERDYKHWKD